MNVDILNFKEKDKLLKHIYTSYRKAKLQLELMDTYFNPYPQSQNLIQEKTKPYAQNYLLKRIEKKRNFELLIEMVDRIHQKVSPDSLLILQKEYLDLEEKGWWHHYYARSTYYRLKHRAIEEFFMYYDDAMLSKWL